MIRSAKCLLGLVLLLLLAGCYGQPRPKRVLIFSRTMGYRHASIEDGVAAIRRLGRENGFDVFATEDPTLFREEFLSTFSAVIFLSTTGDVLDNAQQAEFERYIQAGGGFVGIHAAADTEYDWPWFGRLVGGYFAGHPEIQEAQMDVKDATHPSTKKLTASRLTRTDEWYNYKDLNQAVRVLIELDEASYKGGTMGDFHPISWYHEYDGGRAFYTGWGHTNESYREETFLQHILGGILWAIGPNTIDYSKAHSYRIPPGNRFVQTVLAANLDEPMELDIFDDGRVIFVERKGTIKMWDPRREMLDSVTSIPVYSGFEDGLMGIAIDPNYAENQWVYLYYAPPGEEWCNQISRFTFDGKTWDFDSEKVILKVPTQRITCCHSGGSLEFDARGNLYLSTGDDTNPFASDGYAPIDERPGREPWDAQRTSSNTNDLRGKILRIHPEPDGSYTIPGGNLFPPGTPGTRPEIYVMGCRNPFRISIDKKRGWLYWGDVGPDAGKDGELRGPKGFDEINQARQAGYFGWPYFRGDGKRYYDYDFTHQKSGDLFDPTRPFNDSPNNTGLQELPPFQPSLIWYSYDESDEFPWVGIGGKNPMAGPVFYSEDFAGVKNRFPDYFNDKLFIYEWMRHWIYIIHLDSAGHFQQADRFMGSTEFSRPMDMAFGRDGALYLLEYGEQWFARNPEARLSRIEYVSGNRPPIARIRASKTAGGAPLTVYFSAAGCEDYDGDRMSYEWTFTGKEVQNRTAFPAFTFEKPGIYPVKLKVRDPSGASSTTTLEVQVGNEAPEVAWELGGNRSFFWNDDAITYSVRVSDPEDGSTMEGTIDPGRVKVSIEYLADGYDLTEIAMGHQTESDAALTPFAKGKMLIGQSDCKNCHAEDRKINGPAYLDIARRYAGQPKALETLAARIISGGGGNWGEQAMSAHPQLSTDQASGMVRYILSLAGGATVRSDYPVEGIYRTDRHDPKDPRGAYVLMATYADGGAGPVRSITGRKTVVLRYPRLQAESCQAKSGGVRLGAIRNTNDAMINLTNGQHLGWKAVDFNGIAAVHLRGTTAGPGRVELHLDSPGGPLAGATTISPAPGPKSPLQTWIIPLEAVQGFHELYVVFRNEGQGPGIQAALDWIFLEKIPGQGGRLAKS